MEPDKHKHIQIKSAGLEASGISDLGRERSENEDSIFLDKGGHFLLLADGMGGHERGAEASATALDVIKEYLSPEVVFDELQDITGGTGEPPEIACLFSLVDTAIRKANSKLYKRNRQAELQRYMGTTVVGLIPVLNGYIFWFHVGDSRIYRWRDSTLGCITQDHSAYNEWIQKGRIGDQPSKSIITRAIGPKEAVIADTKWDKRKKDDIYILCSDGLTDMITDEKISEIVTAERTTNSIAVQLIEAANNAGGKDNVSVVVCKIKD
jgi:protein phosphatase